MRIIKYREIKKRLTEPYWMDLAGRDAEVVRKAVNIGIDSHLEACYIAEVGDSYKVKGSRLECTVSMSSLPVLLRRLTEMEYTGKDGDDCDIGGCLATDILGSIGIEVDTGCYSIEP